jgi:hypothetical protein
MPYSAGSFASVIMFFLMFAALRPHFVALREAAASQRPTDGYDIYQPITKEGLAADRAPFTVVSPTLNPGGALAALTISYARPHAEIACRRGPTTTRSSHA